MKIKIDVLLVMISVSSVLSCNKTTTKSNTLNTPIKPPDPYQVVNFKTDGIQYGNFWEYVAYDTSQHADYFYFNSAAYGPFSGSDEYVYAVPDSCDVKIDVLNINGVRVDSTEFGNRQSGIYKIKYDVSKVPSGVYIFKLTACDSSGYARGTILK